PAAVIQRAREIAARACQHGQLVEIRGLLGFGAQLLRDGERLLEVLTGQGVVAELTIDQAQVAERHRFTGAQLDLTRLGQRLRMAATSLLVALESRVD